MNRLGSQTIYSLVSSVAIPNECLVLSKVALHQIPRKWQAACRIISNGFLSWCLKDVVFGCFSLHAVTEKVPSRGSQERQRRKRTLSCFAYSLSDLTALFKITHYYYFTAENAFSTCLTVEKNLIRCVYFPALSVWPLSLFSAWLFETRLVVCHCKNEACPCECFPRNGGSSVQGIQVQPLCVTKLN